MNQRKRVWSLLLAVLLLLSACQKSDPAPKEDTVPEKQEEEQKEEEIPLEPVESFDPSSYANAMMLEDYDFFWTTLEENCAPLGALREVAGADLDQWREEYRQQVAALSDGDAEGFITIITELSRRFGGFAHIGSVDVMLYSRYMSEGSYWESETQKELFQSDKVRAFYQWQETLPIYQRQLQSMEQSNEIDEAADEETVSQEISQKVNLYRQGDTAVAMVRGFDFYGEESNNTVVEMLQKFCLENLDAQDFIIDITQNSGGNEYIWTEGFTPLFAGKKLTHPSVAAYKNGSVNVEMWDGWPENDREVELREFSEITPEEFPQLDPAIRSSCADIAIKTVTDDYSQEENPDGSRFEGRIWILTDKANASSAEDLVLFAKGNPFCTLVGTATGGGGGWMASPVNVDAAMPHCGMLFRFHPFYFINEDGASNDTNGTTPDIEIESGETAMQRCLKEIKKLQK